MKIIISFYSLSILLIIYFLFKVHATSQEIDSLIRANKILLNQHLFKVLDLYVTKALPHLINALVLLGVGRILHILTLNDSEKARKIKPGSFDAIIE